MGTTDANGVYFYDEDDDVSPLHVLLNTGQQSVSDAIGGTARIYRVANATQRAALITALSPSPSNPVFFYRADAVTGSRLEVADGGPVRPVGGAGGEVAGTTNANGIITVAHGLGYQPSIITCEVVGVSSGSETIAILSDPVVWNRDATNIEFRFRRIDTNVWFPGQPIGFTWSAR